MQNFTETNIKTALKQIEASPKDARELTIKNFLNIVVASYNSGFLTSEQLGYYIAGLVQYEDNFDKTSIFTEITKDAGLLELSANHLERKGSNREDLLQTLLKNIASFVG